MLTAKKSAIKSTILEHLSGRSPIIDGSDCCSLSMVILVGPPKTCKKYILNKIFTKHPDKFYQAFFCTTNKMCENKIFKTITVQEFNRMNCTGKLLFKYRFLGHFYGLSQYNILYINIQFHIIIVFYLYFQL